MVLVNEKDGLPALPLTARKLDLLYVSFFLMHIPPSLLLDLQALYPPSLVPELIATLPHLYIEFSRDPLVGGAFGYFGGNSHLYWFNNFVWVEALFQLPTFVIGAYGLWKGYKSVYPLIMIYGASTATTLLPCISLIVSTPTTTAKTLLAGTASVTEAQRMMLLSSYVPFLVIPLLMTVDMAFRVLALIRTGALAEAKVKSQ